MPGWSRDTSSTFTGSFILSARLLWRQFDSGQLFRTLPDGDALTVEVEWGDTSPYSYDYFLVRWDSDDADPNLEAQHKNDAQQIKVDKGGTMGIVSIPLQPRTTCRIYVEGCTNGKGCPQEWSDPVWIDVLPLVLHDMPLPPPMQLYPQYPPLVRHRSVIALIGAAA
jgi:hypothetical protein